MGAWVRGCSCPTYVQTHAGDRMCRRPHPLAPHRRRRHTEPPRPAAQRHPTCELVRSKEPAAAGSGHGGPAGRRQRSERARAALGAQSSSSTSSVQLEAGQHRSQVGQFLEGGGGSPRARQAACGSRRGVRRQHVATERGRAERQSGREQRRHVAAPRCHRAPHLAQPLVSFSCWWAGWRGRRGHL